MAKFRNGLTGSSAAAGDGKDMRELRGRIGKLVNFDARKAG